MTYAQLRKLSFWLSFAFGWIITACVLSVVVTLAGAHAFSGWKSVAIGVAVHTLSAAAGFAYARSRSRPPERRGFPVIPKPDSESETP